MSKYLRLATFVAALAFSAAALVAPRPVFAESAAGLERDADAALASLYEQTPSAKVLAEKAKAVLVFPNIVKAGFIVGASYGEGVLYKQGKWAGFYSSFSGSYGLQAGAQAYGYALFLMTDSTVGYLGKSEGWELGVGPSIVVLDAGKAKNLSTTTLKDDVYAFIFDQKGLMAGIGVQGSKVTKISK
ncbi:MAG: lipid-binding SYLF domain-containing protein [Deltaproteobacteria bacterium]|nr:lipid-binding SYLF domain-containing protein [Deltaproteobacteria bacterium]